MFIADKLILECWRPKAFRVGTPREARTTELGSQARCFSQIEFYADG